MQQCGRGCAACAGQGAGPALLRRDQRQKGRAEALRLLRIHAGDALKLRHGVGSALRNQPQSALGQAEIAPDAVLAAREPHTIAQLEGIPGMDAQKAERFGPAFLSLIAAD